MNDIELLRAYTEQQSEQAFTELANRHLNFVYSAALRVVNDSQLAEDVAQLVFIKLANKATSLPDNTVVAGWLYRATHFVAQTVLRSDWRRRKRETLAMQFTELNRDSESVWKEVAPLLDQAMKELRKTDQDAVLLRFFSGKSLREVGEALGITDDAAQKRVERALERMRTYFANYGVVTSVAAIAPAIAAHAVQTAPPTLTPHLITASLGGGSTTGIGATAFGAAKAMILAHLKTVAVGLVTVALLVTTSVLVVQSFHESNRVGAAASNQLANAAFVIRGTVRKPDGKPLAGALVRVATIGGMVRLYDDITNPIPKNSLISKVSIRTGADGSFAIGLPTVPPERKAVLVVNDDAGYAVMTADELSTNPDITVQPWGRIEGVLRIGKSLASNEMVGIGIWGSPSTYEWTLVSHSTTAKTDANGKFVFPRVFPGDVWVMHTVAVRPGEGRQSGHHYVKVAPGEQVQLQLGGRGHALTGGVAWNGTEKLIFYGSMNAREAHRMRTPRDWSRMSMEEQRKYTREWRESAEGWLFKQEVRNYEFPVRPDGSFRVDDVLPGTYRMQVRADAQVPNGRPPRLAALAEIQIEVPERSVNASDDPLDVGMLSPTPLSE